MTVVPSYRLIILPRRDKKRGSAVTSTMIPHNVISAPAALTTYPDETSDVKTTSIVAWNRATTRMLPRLSLYSHVSSIDLSQQTEEPARDASRIHVRIARTVEEQRRVPERPSYRQQKCCHEGRALDLQSWKDESSPANLFSVSERHDVEGEKTERRQLRELA